MEQGMEITQVSSPKDLKKFIFTGWKILKTGVFHDNFGGDTQFPLKVKLMF
jgi:hypothetical protein